MGQFAQFVGGKSGGMGEVIAALCRGLTERGVAAHLITLNLGSHFLEKSGISEKEWVQQRHHLDTQNIHLVTSSHFEHHHSVYDGDPIQTSCEFQRQIINGHLINIRNKYEGRAIVHSHDWMAGGANAAIRPVATNPAAAYRTQSAYRVSARGDASWRQYGPVMGAPLSCLGLRPQLH